MLTKKYTEIVFGDIRCNVYSKQLRDADYIFHLASLISIPHSYIAAQSYLDTIVNGLINILEGLKHKSFTRMINTSTSEVYGTAQTTPINEHHPMCGQSPYSASKIAEPLRPGIPQIFRFTNMYFEAIQHMVPDKV